MSAYILALYSKVDMLCAFACSPFNVQQHILYYCMKQKHTLIKMCPSMLSKHAIAGFFCLQMEVCCKCAITLVRKIICRVTFWTLVSEVSS